MTSLLINVRPGDIISSQQFNDLINTINSLNSRVAALEAGGAGGTTGPTVGSFVPDQQRAGEVVNIFGSSFATPIINPATGQPNNIVTFDGLTVPAGDFFVAMSSNLSLAVRVPLALDSTSNPIPAQGRVVTVAIHNGQGRRELQYRVLPRLVTTTPAPVISSVQNPATGSGELLLGGTARIAGNNLGGASAIVGLRVETATGPVVFPRANDAAVVVLTSSTANQVDFTVPAYLGDVIAVGQIRTGTVSVTVGSASPAFSSAVLFHRV